MCVRVCVCVVCVCFDTFECVCGVCVRAEAPILWPPDVKSQLIGKDPDAGKDCGQEEKGETENEMVR